VVSGRNELLMLWRWGSRGHGEGREREEHMGMYKENVQSYWLEK